ncbi:hypothetical protein JCM10908_007405 [Rhodotorula pacifica]|uniref:uncharacterized protein n=1 Tax=Rhodotorula pacifica TaxID=1495444 RepID=UPI00317712D0
MAPISFAAPQDAPAQTTLVNEEHNPQVGNYLACTISRKETAAELVDEEHNPQQTQYAADLDKLHLGGRFARRGAIREGRSTADP